MVEDQDIQKLAKALVEIKATPLQAAAAATLLAAVGLDSALEFVAEMAKLNAMRASLLNRPEVDDGLA